jgi:hypothetical protein
MRLILDVDYQDQCLSGQGDRDALKRLFEQSKSAGFDSVLWAPMICGKANYPSRVACVYQDTRMNKGSHRVAEMMRRFDPMEEAIRLSREFDLKLLVYFRLLDDYFPGLEEDFFDQRPHLWWQSRCGNYQLRGWPCYHEPQVREYKLALLKELLDYGPDGGLFELARSHSWYVSPHRQPDFFGFNPPIAKAFQDRHGVDIRQFDYAKFLSIEQGVFERIPYVYSAAYVGAQTFDRTAWHWIKGEGFETFLRDARALLGRKTSLMQGGMCPPHPVALEEIAPATFYLDAGRLAAEGVIDGCLQSANWMKQQLTPDMESFMFPYFQGVREAGKDVGLWLNDIFSPTGGEPNAFASVAEVEAYLRKVKRTSMDFVVVHEADFIQRHPEPEQIWSILRDFRNSTK